MIEFIDFIGKQEIGNILLICFLVIPYSIWIIWFIGVRILILGEKIIDKISENKHEIKILAGKIGHYIWTFYRNVYFAFLLPFIVFCIRWDNFNRYISEIAVTVGLLSVPFFIAVILSIRKFMINLSDQLVPKTNVLAGDAKRQTRHIFANILIFTCMPLVGLIMIFLIIVIPVFAVEVYIKWVKYLFRKKIKSSKVKYENKKNQFILYKYMPRLYMSDNYMPDKNKPGEYTKKTYFEECGEKYLVGMVFFSDTEKFNDPAENITLANRTASISENKSFAARSTYLSISGDYSPLKGYKICCMTSNPANSAMWSHYAEKHTGLCIGFAIDNDILKEGAIEHEKVVYAKFLPVIEDFVYPHDFEREALKWDDIRKLIFYKLRSWKYEDEWRLVIPSDEEGMFRIGRAVRIICGCECPSDFVNKLKAKVQIPVEQVIYERSYNHKEGVHLYVPGENPNALGDFSNREWKYHIKDDSVTILAYRGKQHNVDIPATIRGKPVVAIGEYALEECTELVSVTIPKGICKIGPFAFSGCSGLHTVVIGKDVTIIGKGAFASCSNLKSIVLPKCLSTIGRGAFRDCYELKEIIMPATVKHIRYGAFDGCSNEMIISYTQ